MAWRRRHLKRGVSCAVVIHGIRLLNQVSRIILYSGVPVKAFEERRRIFKENFIHKRFRQIMTQENVCNVLYGIRDP